MSSSHVSKRCSGIVLIGALAAQAAGQCYLEELCPGGAESEDRVGSDVGISGNVAILGAAWDDDNGTSAGAAYVFRLTDGLWVEEAKLLAPDGASGDFLGQAVAIRDDVAFVSAPLADSPGFNAGAVYVFTQTGSGWAYQQKLVAADAAEQDYFGISIWLDDGVVLIGASQGDAFWYSGPGAAYVFRLDGSTWGEEAKLTASDGALGDLFGFDVCLSGDTAIVGAPWDDDDGDFSGSAYVFDYDGSAWQQAQKLTRSGGAAVNVFGSAVAMEGDHAVIGGLENDLITAHFFQRQRSTWIERDAIVYEGGLFSYYMADVALHDDLALLGAPLDDEGGPDHGAVLVYRRDGSQWALEGKWAPVDVPDETYIGEAVAFDNTLAIIGAADPYSGGDDSDKAWVLDLDPRLGDVTCDGVVGVEDLLQLLAAWGPCSGCLEDLNNDGVVGVPDLLTLLANWSD